MTRYQLFICVTALALVLGGTLPGSAQSLPLRLATWDVQIWPEYDDPSVLVIAAGSLAAETPAPQQLRIPIPAGARVHAVAFPGPEGNLLTLPWSAETDASGQTLVFALDQPRFVVEYYADILAPPPSRSFDLDLVAPYAVQQASLALRQPSRASNLQVTPAMAEGGLDGLGNPTYALELGALEAGQAVPVRVSYTKADAEPSVAGLEVDETPAAAADGSAQSSLPVIIGVAAGLLAGAAALYLWTRRRSAGASRQARRRTARKQGTALLRPPTGSAAPGGAALNRFCVQCGQKFEGSDRFCRNCGAARR